MGMCHGSIQRAVSHCAVALGILLPFAVSAHTPRAIIEAALAVHGDTGDAIVEIAMKGTFDLATRLQGRTLASEPTPISERIVIDPARDRLAYDLRWHNYTHSVQDLREIHDAKGRILFVDKRNRNGGWLAGAPVPDAADRYARLLPQYLLVEALSRADTFERLDPIEADGHAVDAIAWRTIAGETLTLYIDQESRLLRGAVSLIDMPLLGRIELMWVWSDYGTDGARQFPTRFRSWLGPELLKDVTVNVSLDSGADAFELPADIDAGDPPEPRAVDAFVPPARRDSDVETIADGVYRVRSLRPGFHLLFVEFADFVVAVDAPTGWYEMQQIPPMNWSHGDDVDDLSEKYIRLIERTVPGKPIRHLVLTHHHSDHIGGLPAFARQGIDMLAGGPAADMARRAMTAYCPVPAAGPGESSPVSDDTMASVDVVRGVRRIADDTMEMLLVELPIDNPKAEGFLVVYLPKQRLIYATAFIYPVPEAAFPPAESVDLATWFVDWLDRSGLDVDLHYNVHGTGVVEPWHLNKLREIAAERRRPAAGAHAD